MIGLSENIFVLSIDADLFPIQPADALAALLIFGLLAALFCMSLLDAREHEGHQKKLL